MADRKAQPLIGCNRRVRRSVGYTVP